MALRITFEPGPKQSLEASRYFSDVSADILTAALPSVEPRHILYMQNGKAPLPMRIWATQMSDQQRLTGFMDWVRQVAKGMFALGHRSDIAATMELAQTWLQQRHTQGDLFVEMLDPAHAFTPDENNELSIGIVDGETVMLSARNVMFAKLSAGLFGLTVAGMGSWLIEQLDRKEDTFAWSRTA